MLALYHAELFKDNAPDQQLHKAHEQRLSQLYRDTLQIAFGTDNAVRDKSIERFLAYASISVNEKLSPNLMELQKMVSNSLALLARSTPVRQRLQTSSNMQVDEGSNEGQLNIDQVIEKLREACCNKSSDVNYKSNLMGSLA